MTKTAKEIALEIVPDDLKAEVKKCETYEDVIAFVVRHAAELNINDMIEISNGD